MQVPRAQSCFVRAGLCVMPFVFAAAPELFALPCVMSHIMTVSQSAQVRGIYSYEQHPGALPGPALPA